MDLSAGPDSVIWDITYACPLRCIHCYSESGRRPTRQLSHADMLRVTEAIISMRPSAVALTGGEPLLVKGICEIADRFSAAGIPVVLYTGGWVLDTTLAEDVTRSFSRISVSLDGATAAVHDRIRGRAGSFDRAMSALSLLDAAASRLGPKGFELGIDISVMRSNLNQLEAFCTDIAPQYPRLDYLYFAAAMPAGLASRPGFSDHELLTDEQVAGLETAGRQAELRAVAPSSVVVSIGEHLSLMMRPDLVARGIAYLAMQIEPDGGVRAMPVYEGVVGNVLTSSPAELWKRCVARWSDPVVVEALSGAHTMQGWAVAARTIDYHFGSAADRARIDRRPELLAISPV